MTLSPHASNPDTTRGRLYPEPESAMRSPFQRDRDRIIHSTGFRRLKYKTQVFVYHEGDHYRTRLTHSIEVAQIARTLARALKVDEDLTEAIALAHDLGHTPFAHAGEEALSQCMEPYGGFDHNDQSLRVLTMLENKYPDWRGLNLTWETLEGIAKHNGPVTSELPITFAALQEQIDLMPGTYASIEAQIAALADDIAYNNHDVEDGLRAKLFTAEDVEDVSLLARLKTEARAKYPGTDEWLLMQEVIRQMIGTMVRDVREETQRRLNTSQPKTADDIRHAGQAMVSFSEEMLPQIEELRAFLYARMYRHDNVDQMWHRAGEIVPVLFRTFMADPSHMPQSWQVEMEDACGVEGCDTTTRARFVADYIAGMTDRYALGEVERLKR